MGLLRSATAFEAYCKVYTADLTPEWILEFLLLDAQFPHSLRFSIDSLQCALQAIQLESGKNRAEELHRIAGRLSASLRFASVDEILNGDVVAYLRNINNNVRPSMRRSITCTWTTRSRPRWPAKLKGR